MKACVWSSVQTITASNPFVQGTDANPRTAWLWETFRRQSQVLLIDIAQRHHVFAGNGIEVRFGPAHVPSMAMFNLLLAYRPQKV